MYIPRTYFSTYAQNVERKTQTKICCHYTWLLHVKSWLSQWRFLRSFLTASKPSGRPSTAGKRKEKEKKERPKNIPLSQNYDFCACPRKNVPKHDASGKKAKLSWCKYIFDQIKANLAEIQPKNQQNVQETSFSQKASGFNGLREFAFVSWASEGRWSLC